MPDLMSQVLLYMSFTFLLGLVLGWLLWQYGSHKLITSMETEMDFWKSNLDQSRQERQEDAGKMEILAKERADLEAQIAKMKKAKS